LSSLVAFTNFVDALNQMTKKNSIRVDDKRSYAFLFGSLCRMTHSTVLMLIADVDLKGHHSNHRYSRNGA